MLPFLAPALLGLLLLQARASDLPAPLPPTTASGAAVPAPAGSAAASAAVSGETNGPAVAPAAAGVEAVPPPARVKADYLFKFLSYVEFPAALQPPADKPLVIGVAGADDVYQQLGEVLRARQVQGHAVTRVRLGEGDTLSGVQVLFAGRQLDLARSPLVKLARSGAALLVTDSAEGLAHGAVFNFLMVDDRVRFETSLEAAERAAIRVSSRLLSVSERVSGGR